MGAIKLPANAVAFSLRIPKQKPTDVPCSVKSNQMFKYLFTALTIIFVAVLGWFFVATRPVTYKSFPPTDFEIKSGWSVDRIGQELSSAKLIRSRAAFKITVITMGIGNKVQAGFFKISPDMSITDIAKSLTHASIKTVRVTIPEGLRRQEIALIIDNALKNIDGKAFTSAEFISLTVDKEGRLFPDTYDFDPKSTTQAIVDRLEGRYLEIMASAKVKEADQNKITTLASLLEREAADSSEMPEIAGVIENRLNASWPLQIDATVQYAISNVRCKKLDCDWWPKTITTADLQVKSPYNTYLYQGLPPKPISNPGEAAIKAAAAPQKTTAWFYLHDPKGVIHFANTLEEHNQNVCIYLQKDCSN
jgi:UPF0755 protein